MEDQGKRIVLFVVLAAAIFFGWQWLFPSEREEPKKPPAEQAAEQAANKSPIWTEGTAAAPAVPEQTIELTSKNLSITFSNIGAVVKRVHRGFDPMKGAMNDDLFVSPAKPGVGFLATTVLGTHPLTPTQVWTGEKLGETKVRYTTKAGDLTVVKDFELVAEEWLLKVTLETHLPETATKATQTIIVTMFGIAPPPTEKQKAWRNQPGANCNLGGDVKTSSARSVERRPRELSGNVKYVGVATPFFMFGVAPKTARGDQLECNIYPLADVKDGVQVDLEYPQATGEAPIRKEMVAFLGPKYLDKLEGADEIAGYSTGFKDSIDFGWFGFISRPLLWLLRNIFGFVGNWGIAIILLTMIVKLATLYWTQKSMKSMRAMAALKPEMDALQKKYPDDRQKQQQAQMELFKRHGVNPLSGCLPMLLQMPIWMGLYTMLSHVGELHQAVFIPGWLEDLTLRDPYYILPIALTGFMFLQSRIQPATGDSMQQKMIMYGMPLMFGVMGLWFPSGLTVYITTNTLLGIAHSLYMKKTAPALPSAVKTEVKAVAKTDDASDAKAAPARKKVAPAKPVIEVEADEVASSDDEAADDDGESSDDDGESDARPAPRPNGPRPAGVTAPGAAGQQRRGKRRPKRR